MKYEGVEWINVAKNKVQGLAVANTAMNIRVP
jgi:hypothetical protein